MESIFEGYIRAKINAEVILKAFELNIEHNDLIDCMLYSITLYNNMKFASLDKELKRFVRENKLKYLFF